MVFSINVVVPIRFFKQNTIKLKTSSSKLTITQFCVGDNMDDWLFKTKLLVLFKNSVFVVLQNSLYSNLYVPLYLQKIYSQPDVSITHTKYHKAENIGL